MSTVRLGLVLTFVLLTGCEATPTLGDSCARTSECAVPFACVYGRCRSQCAESRDCSIGLRCIRSDDGNGVCTLDVEERCTESICAAPLMCVDLQCRTECSRDTDCRSGTCVMSSCVEPVAGRDAGTSTDASVDAAVSDTGTDAGPLLPVYDGVSCETQSELWRPIAQVIVGGGAGAGLAQLTPRRFDFDASDRPAQVAIAARTDGAELRALAAWIEAAPSGASLAHASQVTFGASPSAADITELGIERAAWIDVGVDAGDWLGVVTFDPPDGKTVAWIYDEASGAGPLGEIIVMGTPRGQTARTAIVGGRSQFTGAGPAPTYVFRESRDGVPHLGAVDRTRTGTYVETDTFGLAPALETSGGHTQFWVARDPATGDVVFWDRSRPVLTDVLSLAVNASGPPSVAGSLSDPARTIIAYPEGTVVRLQTITCTTDCGAAERVDVASLTGRPVMRVAIAAVAGGFALATLEGEGSEAVVVLRYTDDAGTLVARDALEPLFVPEAGETVADLRVAAAPSSEGAGAIVAVYVDGPGRDSVWLGGHFACIP